MAHSTHTVFRRAALGSALAALLALSACSSDATDDAATTSSAPTTQQTTTDATSDAGTPLPSATTQEKSTSEPVTAPDGNADLATAEFELQWNDAVDIAKSHFEGELSEVGLDWEGKQWAYSVELVSETEEYDAKISATDGALLREETDAVDRDAQDGVFDPSTVIDLHQAKDAALDARKGRITEWKLEGMNQGVFFEFEILPDDGGDVDVRVDAMNGQVVKVG